MAAHRRLRRSPAYPSGDTGRPRSGPLGARAGRRARRREPNRSRCGTRPISTSARRRRRPRPPLGPHQPVQLDAARAQHRPTSEQVDRPQRRGNREDDHNQPECAPAVPVERIGERLQAQEGQQKENEGEGHHGQDPGDGRAMQHQPVPFGAVHLQGRPAPQGGAQARRARGGPPHARIGAARAVVRRPRRTVLSHASPPITPVEIDIFGRDRRRHRLSRPKMSISTQAAPGRSQRLAEPTEPRRSQASTTRAAMPFSAALPHERGS